LSLPISLGESGGSSSSFEKEVHSVAFLEVSDLVKDFGGVVANNHVSFQINQGEIIGLIGPDLADQFTAGVIILAAAPCTAMVFVWSYLTDGDPAYTLVQVALLTERINQLTSHMATNRHDYHTQYGLLKLVGKRRRLLA
jgi:ribosomal protein S15P/S13E